ncbi:hypothetical protein HCH54_005227 [Aspergillus fumigatus]
MEMAPFDSRFIPEEIQVSSGAVAPSSSIYLGAGRDPEQRCCQSSPSSSVVGGLWFSYPNYAHSQLQYPGMGMVYSLPLVEEAAPSVVPSYAHLPQAYAPFYHQQNYTFFQVYGAPIQPLIFHIPVPEPFLPWPSVAWEPRYYHQSLYPSEARHSLQCLSADVAQQHWGRYHDVRVHFDNRSNHGSRGAKWQASKSTIQSSGDRSDDVRCSSISTAWIRVRRRRQEPNMSTFAIWVGNIPRDAGIMDLVDHFAQDATEDIQSVFLIIKSQCAFVNYRTEKACRTAFSRFDGSILKRKRLLCRLRMGVRPSAARSTAPVSDCAEGLEHGGEDSRLPKTEGSTQTRYSAPRTTDRYFIMKSHTVADLEMSSKTGVWATQIHNEGIT